MSHRSGGAASRRTADLCPGAEIQRGRQGLGAKRNKADFSEIPCSNMPAAYELKFRDGRVELLSGHRGYYYAISAYTLLHFMPIPAWCHHCKRVKLAEDLMKREEIEVALKESENPESAWHRKHKSRP